MVSTPSGLSFPKCTVRVAATQTCTHSVASASIKPFKPRCSLNSPRRGAGPALSTGRCSARYSLQGAMPPWVLLRVLGTWQGLGGLGWLGCALSALHNPQRPAPLCPRFPGAGLHFLSPGQNRTQLRRHPQGPAQKAEMALGSGMGWFFPEASGKELSASPPGPGAASKRSPQASPILRAPEAGRVSLSAHGELDFRGEGAAGGAGPGGSQAAWEPSPVGREPAQLLQTPEHPRAWREGREGRGYRR